MATGLISFLYFVLLLRMYRDPEKDAALSAAEFEYIRAHQESAPGGIVAQPASLGYLLLKRKVIGLAVFGFYNYVFYLLLAWLPSHLSEFHFHFEDLRLPTALSLLPQMLNL